MIFPGMTIVKILFVAIVARVRTERRRQVTNLRSISMLCGYEVPAFERAPVIVGMLFERLGSLIFFRGIRS